ncbi:hypothetical protein JCM10213_006915 [Rhodosporidiobolus nylandii]
MASSPSSSRSSTASTSTRSETFTDAEAGTTPALTSAQASRPGSAGAQDDEEGDVGERQLDNEDGEGLAGAGTERETDGGATLGAHRQAGEEEGDESTALPASFSSSSLSSTSSSILPTSTSQQTLQHTLTPFPPSAPPSAPSAPPSSSRPASIASLSGLNATVAANPHRLSLSFADSSTADDEDQDGEGQDDVGPLTGSTSPEKVRRPFSLSSEPETPTSRTGSPSSSPARSRKSLLLSSSHGPSSDPTAVGREASPSLTEAVWRQSLGLSVGSPLGSPLGGKGEHGRGLMDIRLDDGDEDEREGGEEAVDGPETPRGTGRKSYPNGLSRQSQHRTSLVPLSPPPSGGNGADPSSSSSLLPPAPIPSPHRDRQASIATPHAADGFLTNRASLNLSSLSAAVTPDNPPSGFSAGGVREIQASFEAVRRREGSEEDAEVDWDFWGKVVGDYEGVAREQPRELSRAIQKGIPPALRGMTWQLMAAAKDANLEFVYSELLKQSSPHEKSIARDLSRTFPKHEYFSEAGGVGQENLFNVVKAYSLYDDEVGYTQGLQFIVGPLLLNMPDEESFCLLVRLMKAYDLRSHYTPNMPGLQLRLFQFDRLVEELLPGVFLHLLRQGVKSSMYASQWFLTLFGYRFPLEVVSSVFDLVFAEGVEAVFRFAVALLKKNEHHLCQLEFEDLIEFLKNGLFEGYAPDPEELEKNPDALYKVNEFVRDALLVRITPMMLDQFGEEWASLCAQQTAHAAELDSLRKANMQLSLQVRQLEASLAQINQEHVEMVKQVVKSRLEREELEDELVKYKLAYADLAHLNAAERASTSPLQLRRQSELSIASSFDDGASTASAQTAATSASSGGGALAGLAGAGRWFGGIAGGGGRASSSAMSQRSVSNRSESGY